MLKKTIPNWLQKARTHWQFKGEQRPDFAETPNKGQRSVWDFPRPPILEKTTKLIKVKYKGELIAGSAEAMMILETAHPPTYYIPPQHVKKDILVKIPDKSSFCEWKGAATYWALKDKPQIMVGWSYAKPYDEFSALTDYYSFYPDVLDCYVDDEKARRQPGNFYAGWITDEFVGPFKGEPKTGHW